MILLRKVNPIYKVDAAKPYTNVYIQHTIFERLQIMSVIQRGGVNQRDVHDGYIGCIHFRNNYTDVVISFY